MHRKINNKKTAPTKVEAVAKPAKKPAKKENRYAAYVDPSKPYAQSDRSCVQLD